MDIDVIQRRIEMIEKLQNEIKISKDMLKDVVENDSAYKEAAEEAKTGSLRKKQLLNEIYNQPKNTKALQEIKANREEIITLKEMLSEELIEYRQESRMEVIEGTDGKERGFKFSVRLVNKSS